MLRGALNLFLPFSLPKFFYITIVESFKKRQGVTGFYLCQWGSTQKTFACSLESFFD